MREADAPFENRQLQVSRRTHVRKSYVYAFGKKTALLKRSSHFLVAFFFEPENDCVRVPDRDRGQLGRPLRNFHQVIDHRFTRTHRNFFRFEYGWVHVDRDVRFASPRSTCHHATMWPRVRVYREFLSSLIRCEMKSDAAQTVATHFSDRSIGIPDPHARSTMLECNRQNTVRSDSAVAVTEACDSRPIERTDESRCSRRSAFVDHDEIVPESFVFCERYRVSGLHTFCYSSSMMETINRLRRAEARIMTGRAWTFLNFKSTRG